METYVHATTYVHMYMVCCNNIISYRIQLWIQNHPQENMFNIVENVISIRRGHKFLYPLLRKVATRVKVLQRKFLLMFLQKKQEDGMQRVGILNEHFEDIKSGIFTFFANEFFPWNEVCNRRRHVLCKLEVRLMKVEF